MASVRNLSGAARMVLAAGAVAAAFAMTARPSAAQSGAASPPAADAAKLAKGKDVFVNYGCGSCHTLKDAGSVGDVGPSFDGDANLTHDLVVSRVTNGQGAMPSFSGQMTPEEIDAVAAYVVHAAAK